MAAQLAEGRMRDFMAKLKEAGDPRFKSQVMPKSLRLLRSTVRGMAHAPSLRTTIENGKNSLVSVELWTEFDPADAI
jgi:hypothetical protein